MREKKMPILTNYNYKKITKKIECQLYEKR